MVPSYQEAPSPSPATAPRLCDAPGDVLTRGLRALCDVESLAALVATSLELKRGDPGDVRMLTHLETPFLRAEGETGCDPDIDAVPDNGGIQTYGSGAFATLWVAPFEYGGASWPERGCPEPHCPATPELDDPVVGTYYDMTEDVIREVALPTGLVDTKVCAIDEVWSGLKLVVRKELRNG